MNMEDTMLTNSNGSSEVAFDKKKADASKVRILLDLFRLAGKCAGVSRNMLKSVESALKTSAGSAWNLFSRGGALGETEKRIRALREEMEEIRSALSAQLTENAIACWDNPADDRRVQESLAALERKRQEIEELCTEQELLTQEAMCETVPVDETEGTETSSPISEIPQEEAPALEEMEAFEEETEESDVISVQDEEIDQPACEEDEVLQEAQPPVVENADSDDNPEDLLQPLENQQALGATSNAKEKKAPPTPGEENTGNGDRGDESDMGFEG